MAITVEPWKLLPITASKLERDLLKILPVPQVILDGVQMIGIRKIHDIPDSFLPWLVLEHGLVWMREYLDDDRVILEQGIELNQIKGTPASLKMVLSWFGFESASVHEADRPLLHFAEFEIDPGDIIVDLDRIPGIFRAINEVQPARSRFRRIFHGYDKRLFYLCESKLNSEFLGHPSGINFDDLGRSPVKTELTVSFGREHASICAEENFDILDYYFKENFYRHNGHIDPAFPNLCEDFEGDFYEPRLSAFENQQREGTSIVLQPVASWDGMSWRNRSWEGLGLDNLGIERTELVAGALLLDGDEGTILLEDGNRLLF